jgi:dynein heavy chain
MIELIMKAKENTAF